MKHNKSHTTFLHEIVISFSAIYLSEATYVINSFKWQSHKELIPDATIIP